ncbi:MAG: Ryanodine receptor Ryr [Bacteroidales bacterium]|nr:Ryanodine receptor Ryr [Candidatus Colicola equi]
MKSNKFTPSPANTTNVKLPKELQPLVEIMAANVHNVWAQNRIQEGWTYGLIRDDYQKQTPCLVPYEQLPEYEKEYDRQTALETIKLLIKLGWKIEKQ